MTDDRVLVLMPTAKDGERTAHALTAAGLEPVVCADLAALCREIGRGAGLALLTEEAAEGDRAGSLQAALHDQPPWSDFPLVVLARAPQGQGLRETMNVTLVERPVKMRSLLSVIRAALRSRRRQYELRDHLAQRLRAEEELRASDRRKDEFIALLAHELRNPLAPIRNGLQVLRLAEDSAKAERARAMMDRQLSHMVRLIDDLLDVSRINRNKMELRRERILLTEVISNAVETARPLIEAAGHELMVTLPGTPVTLDADQVRLAQVFSNLLTNSAKYTEQGGSIRLRAERKDGNVVVSVHDSGIGIPAQALPHIFDMFSQVDRSIERSTGGLGIGLALVKGLVEMHGGTVVAESGGPGRGSVFTVTLPLPSQELRPEKNQDALPDHGVRRRILVVDDNRDGAESMALMLQMLGDEVQTAYNGLEAVAQAEAFRPEVILMDLGMPRLNGLEATRHIRAQPWGQEMTIIALTGWGQEGDKERSRAAGCNGHLVKPVSLPDLERLLNGTGLAVKSNPDLREGLRLP